MNAMPTLLIPLGCLLLHHSVLAANWPNWRGGVEGAGVAPGQSYPVEWDESKNLRWKIKLPERGNSTPVVWGNRIFVTQALEAEGRRTLMCFDRTGRQIWQSGTVYREKEDTHETNPYCSASPTTDGERVIVSFGSAGVFCYDFDGKELWRRDLGKLSHEWGYAASPLIHKDVCIVYHGPGPGSSLVGLNKRSGEVIWKFDEPPARTEGRQDGFKGREPGIIGSFSTPILIHTGGRDELVMSFAGWVEAFDPATGKRLWTCDGLNPLVYASPIHGEGVVLAMGGFFGSSIAVRPGGEGDVTAKNRLWMDPRAKKNRCGSAVVKDGLVFLTNMEGFVECLELRSGRQLWEERLPKKGAKSESWSSTLLVGDHVYAVNQSGDVIVFKAAPKFEVVAVNSIGNEMTNASLVPCDGTFLLRTHEHLWCFGESPQTASSF